MTRAAIVIPGRIPIHQAVLGIADAALFRRGVETYRISWEPPESLSLDERLPWVCAQVSEAIDNSGFEKPLLIGKSLGTLAGPVAFERALPAIWLTPLLHAPQFVSSYENTKAPRLFIGGTGDEGWKGDVARRLSPHICEVEGADHGMFLPGPLSESGPALAAVGGAVETFLDEVVWPV